MSQPSLVLFPEKRYDSAYQPSFQFGAADLGEPHLGAEQAVRDVPGWLRMEDALKLYELAFFARGPILEIGSYYGKSAIILARGAKAGGSEAIVYSVDVDAQALSAARRAAASHGVADRIVFVRGSLRALLRACHGLRPMFVFVDGDHSLGGVRRDLEALQRIVPNDALLLFHDFHDPRNEDPENQEIGVREAVEGSWVAADCAFGGVFGCCGLFRRDRGGAAAEPGPPVVDLLLRDSLQMQYRQRLRGPLGRTWRTLRGGKRRSA
jgi:SAM-dependent methyltransferase